jgi:hypothetical protein
MPSVNFPVLEIVAISDATTLIVAGDGVGELREDEELYVLSVGQGKVPKTNAPLVFPKAKVEVTFAAGVYAIVRPPVEEFTVPSSFAAIEAITGNRTVRKRRPLDVDEAAMIGRPRSGPIAVGDPVVRTKDLADYIQYLARTGD